MPSEIPGCPREKPEPAQLAKRADEERLYRIELVTPLFGGGVDAGENDPTMPIRGTAIRGQLQFWWRATRGAAFATLAELRERHRAVWGATDSASAVIVEVAEVQASEPVPCGTIAWNAQARGRQGAWRVTWCEPFRHNEHLRYVLFPFQGVLPRNDRRAQVEEHPAKCIHAAAFTLRLRFPAAVKDDVEAAVWAWVNFGGVGARTRRGCGALLCREFAPQSADQVRGWFVSSLAALVPHAGIARPWSVLPQSVLSRLEPSQPLDAWNRLTGVYKYFRQGEDFARNQGRQANRPGRSRYPEPESIRRAMQVRARQHARLPAIPDTAYPRAELGLPMVFHFQGQGDPADPQGIALYPVRAAEREDRMASPMILKPLVLADGRAIPVVVPLLAPRVTEVELVCGKRPVERRGVNDIRNPRLAAYPGSPLAGLSPAGSALEAFLAFVRQPPHSFVEITP